MSNTKLSNIIPPAGVASSAQGAKADTALQPSDNVSALTNDANYIDAAGAPVQSVNGETGVVVLDKGDVGLGNVPNLDTTDAVAKAHDQNTDTKLAEGTADEVTAAQIAASLPPDPTGEAAGLVPQTDGVDGYELARPAVFGSDRADGDRLLWVYPPFGRRSDNVHITVFNRLSVNPITFFKNRTVTEIACECTVAGSGGAFARMGIYEVLPDGATSLVVDAGTVNLETSGVKVITGLSVPVVAGKTYIAGAILGPSDLSSEHYPEMVLQDSFPNDMQGVVDAFSFQSGAMYSGFGISAENPLPSFLGATVKSGALPRRAVYVGVK